MLRSLRLGVLFKTLNPSRNYCHSRLFSKLNDVSNYIECSDREMKEILSYDFHVTPDFISAEEEELLMKEIDRSMKRLRYEFTHWDDAIHGFRETEKSSWNPENSVLIDRIKNHAFSTKSNLLPYIHVLDLAKEGYIKAHVDSIKFCGNVIAGLSLLSSSVMRLQSSTNSQRWTRIELPRRSLYILKDRLRYEFTHEILKDSESYVNGRYISRDRRISVMCRKHPGEK